ncbi:packaged DNA stabilization protein [Sphingorhabdus sp. SMR4y]|uniref:packaged DNA stabilization protein n=1 Tax=Sphingorhabdus sp. SMR4y TaxID=2584094 RepID=UPI000B5C74D4|nr:packaged DNA stabilization protein [Sphingorhabdus sp. SMR4y]ASK88464.1 phage stabilization protein [Sphingorhabdus sp. SMR4y]
MQIDYGRSAYTRSRGNLPPLDLVNLFVEKGKAGDPTILQSRKGIVSDSTHGSGPIKAVFQREGVFGGDRFAVSGSGFYRGATLLGTIDGTGTVSIAASDLEILVTAGSSLYSYDGTDFVAVSFPDSADVTAVVHTAGYFIALRAETGQWYFSNVLDGRTWEGLDFATAESEPDYLLDICVLDGILVLGGINSIEFWAATGNQDLPFSQIQQREFEQGVAKTGCVVVVDNSFYFLGSDLILYRNGEVPEAISDDAIVEASQASATHRLFLVSDERHKFVCLRLDNKTMAYDITTREWCEFKSYGRTNWRVGPGMGDDETGTVWAFSGYLDNSGPMERLFTAGAVLEGPAQIFNLRLSAEVGTTDYLAGDYADPQIEMRYSDDAGNTWEEWELESLGEQGDYSQRVEWRALGMFADPGALFQFRVSDPVSVRFSNVQANAPIGGR